MYRSSYAFVAGCFFPMCPAFACVVEEGSFNPPEFLIEFLIAFIVSMFAVFMFTFLAWVIKSLFFRHASLFSTFLVSASLLALLLGVLGSFVIPEFELVFASFRADLPVYTKAIFGNRQFLWLPALLVLALWFLSKNSFNRTRYFAAALFVEANLLFLVVLALYGPIFKLGAACG